MVSVSIVMPTFRQKRQYLEQAIKAFLKQTHKNIELIVVPVKGDRSTLVALRQFKDQRLIVRTANYALITHQMNLGAYASTGKYLLPGVGSDDRYYPKAIAALLKFAQSKNTVIAYPDFDVGNASLHIKRTKRCPRFNRELLDKGCYMCDDSLVLRDEFMKYLPMRNSDGKSRIWNIWKRMADNPNYKGRIMHVRLRTHIYRDHGDSVHRHGSQREFRAVELKSSSVSPSSVLKGKDINSIRQRDFCVFVKDIPLFAKNAKCFAFKKVILSWDGDNIQHLNLVSDTSRFYNWAFSEKLCNLLREHKMRFVRLLKNPDIADYINDMQHDLVLESK